VSFHAVPRNTGDIDICVKGDKTNARRMLRVLKEFGFQELGITEEDLLNPDIVIQLGYEPHRIDILTSLSGVNFVEAFRSRVKGRFGGQEANFLSFEHLLKNKKAAGRSKDKADVDLLMNYATAKDKRREKLRQR
jgi:hypothetical protein